MEERYHSNFC